MVSGPDVTAVDASAGATKQAATKAGSFVGLAIQHTADVGFTVHDGTSVSGALLWCGRYESAGSGAVSNPPAPVPFGPAGCFVDFKTVSPVDAVILVAV